MTITKAQEYLTVNRDGEPRQIVNIELLLKKHPPDAVIEFLLRISKDIQRGLRKRLLRDRTDPVINDLVAKLFRLSMAVSAIREGEEAIAA